MAGKGGPVGNKNSTMDKRLLSNAMRRELLKKAQKGPDAASRIAQALVSKAMDGDLHAIQLLSDRVEGKAAQAIALTGGDENDLPVAITIKGK